MAAKHIAPDRVCADGAVQNHRDAGRAEVSALAGIGGELELMRQAFAIMQQLVSCMSMQISSCWFVPSCDWSYDETYPACSFNASAEAFIPTGWNVDAMPFVPGNDVDAVHVEAMLQAVVADTTFATMPDLEGPATAVEGRPGDDDRTAGVEADLRTAERDTEAGSCALAVVEVLPGDGLASGVCEELEGTMANFHPSIPRKSLISSHKPPFLSPETVLSQRSLFCATDATGLPINARGDVAGPEFDVALDGASCDGDLRTDPSDHGCDTVGTGLFAGLSLQERCSDVGADGVSTKCCRISGHDCFENEPRLASCMEPCIPGMDGTVAGASAGMAGGDAGEAGAEDDFDDSGDSWDAGSGGGSTMDDPADFSAGVIGGVDTSAGVRGDDHAYFHKLQGFSTASADFPRLFMEVLDSAMSCLPSLTVGKHPVVLTDQFDIRGCKQIRRCGIGEELQQLQEPSIDSNTRFTRTRVRTADGGEGWITTRGNQGTDYVTRLVPFAGVAASGVAASALAGCSAEPSHASGSPVSQIRSSRRSAQ